MRRIIFCIVLAFLLWTLMFSPHLAFVNKNVSFWWMMTASALLLTTLSFSFYGKKLKQSLSRFGIKSVLGGILLAALIWGVFFVGDKLSSLMFSFARPQVDSIYGLKASDPHWLIAMLLLSVLQRNCSGGAMSKTLSLNAIPPIKVSGLRSFSIRRYISLPLISCSLWRPWFVDSSGEHSTGFTPPGFLPSSSLMLSGTLRYLCGSLFRGNLIILTLGCSYKCIYSTFASAIN